MSYILDALKKAEQERRLGPRAAFEPVRSERPRLEPRRWAWPLVLGGGLALLLAGAGAVTLWRPGAGEVEHPVQPPPAAGDRAVEAAAATAPPAAIPRPATPRPALPTVTPPAEEASPPKRVTAAAPAPRRPVPVSRPAPVVAPATPTQASPVPVESARPAPGEARPSEAAAPRVAPAGPAPGEAIARMKLEVHVYSESPAARMVFINGRKYVEGDRVEDKYLLERITQDGVTLSHQGQRVHLVP